MSIVIDRNPEAKFEELANPETSKTAEILDALKELPKGEFVTIQGQDENARGLSRRITVAIKRIHASREGKQMTFDTKRVGPEEWAVMRRN